ncbi:MAG: LysR family transcriptional regulator [Solirubrobacteraceae bacterium]
MPAPAADPLSSADLVAFVVAMEAGSVHGAADALGLTASAVSKRLQSLERRAGVLLFDRGRHGLRATGAGRALYPEAKAALAALGDAELALREHRKVNASALALAASHTIGEFLLPGWLAEFRRRHPDARAQIDIVNSPAVLAAVRNRSAEIGFVEGLDPLQGFDAITVHRDELVAVVARGHRWARRRSLAAAELASEAYLAREAGSGTRAVAAAALAGAGIKLSPALEVASSQSLKRALTAGGFAIMSRLAVTAELEAGTLQIVAIRDLDLTRELKAVREARRPRSMPSQTSAFWRWLTDLPG